MWEEWEWLFQQYPHVQLEFAWQRSFYDQIICDDVSLDKARAYVRNNPAEWTRDSENINKSRCLSDVRLIARIKEGERSGYLTAANLDDLFKKLDI